MLERTGSVSHAMRYVYSTCRGPEDGSCRHMLLNVHVY